jgi:type II secretory pathway component GspD/PulD (secretin)
VLLSGMLLGEATEDAVASISSKPGAALQVTKNDTFTINFSNIGIIEYIRFVSKTLGANFIFDETDLQFNVTIVSEEPITSKNLLSALVQVLRIHGLTLLEQENNFLITKNQNVSQIATVVSSDTPEKKVAGAPIVTRVFRIKNVPASSIATVIRPMMSASAIVEVANETRQLIVTDITTNVDKIATLLTSLDSPHTSLEMESYVAKNVTTDQLVTLATQILGPFLEGNPLLLVPQDGSNVIYIVSTPHLIEKAMSVLSDLDLMPGKGKSGRTLSPTQFYIYQPKFREGEQITHALNDIAEKLKSTGLSDPDLFETIQGMRWSSEINSLLFAGTQKTLDRLKEMLAAVDEPMLKIPGSSDSKIQRIGNISFLLYKPKLASPAQLMGSLKAISSDFQKANAEDKAFADAIHSMKLVKETGSILFTGTQQALEKVEALADKFDVPGASKLGLRDTDGLAPGTFVTYKPVHQTGEALIEILRDFEHNLIDSGVVDRGLFDAINNLKWIDRTNSLLISGDSTSIAKVQELLQKFDVSGGSSSSQIEMVEDTNFLVYKLQYHRGEELRDALRSVGADLSKNPTPANQALLTAINSLEWIKITNSLLCTGPQETLVRLRELIQNLDVPMRQVFIEVLVVETSLANTQNFGLQWGSKLQFLNRTAAGMGNFPITAAPTQGGGVPSASTGLVPGINAANGTTGPLAANIPFFQGFDLGVIGDIIWHNGKSFLSLGSLVNALQTDTDSTIILNPKIITQDNNNSTIFVGNNVPYVGSLINSTTSSQTAQTNIEYRDIGVSLSITPFIGSGDVITLDIVHDISEVQNNTTLSATVTQGTITGILTSHTNMSTRVSVPNKHFVVLSGMLQDSKTHFKSQIPCLGGLPVVGAAFQENDRLNSKANIIIFVRPHIIDSFDDYKGVTENQENLFKDQAVLPVLKEEFDAGIDMVKTAENE